MRDERFVAARREACAWLAEHPEIPWATLDAHDGQVWVLLGTRTTHAAIEIYDADGPVRDADIVRAKLDRGLGRLGDLDPGEGGSCS